ncbi:MAG: T9SS type A sorting domain-containing protein [bacterium]|nr:T9SS type A sorting domain-containing protein [bacterium]
MIAKKYIELFLIVLISFLNNQYSFSADPRYTLKVTNIFKTHPNALEFDINIIHSNPDSSIFEYAAGQYFFNFNTAIGNSGTFTYSIVSSDLPLSMQPRNPIVFVIGGEMQLRLTINPIPNPGQGIIISSSGQGTKIVRMRLQTNAVFFDEQYLHLRWRNGSSNPYTKIYSYIGSTLVEITNPATHFIDSLSVPLPVELNNFTALVNGNNIDLKWTTSGEINNKGFQIERESQSEWVNLGFVTGKGNTNSINEYSFPDRNLQSGIYRYRLKQIDYNGDHTYYYLSENPVIGLPSEFYISQNYPNPFNPSTNIDYNLPEAGNVEITLFDMTGKKVFTSVSPNKAAGYHIVKLNMSSIAGGLASGVYFYSIMFSGSAGTYSETKKLIFMK